MTVNVGVSNGSCYLTFDCEKGTRVRDPSLANRSSGGVVRQGPHSDPPVVEVLWDNGTASYEDVLDEYRVIEHEG